MLKLTVNASKSSSLLLLNKPPVNSLCKNLLKDISAAIKQVEKEKPNQNWGLVLSANNYEKSNIFTGGLDLMEMYKKSETEVIEFWTALQEAWLALYTTPLYTVAALNGTSPAGGCLLAMSCDYRIASETPKESPIKYSIGLNEAKFGLVAPFWFQKLMVDLIGYRKADKMLQLGEMLPFEDALKINLLDELAPNKTVLMEKALSIADTNSQSGPYQSRVETKLLLKSDFVTDFKNKQKKDALWFANFVKQPQVEQMLEKYISSLKSKKKP